MYNHKSVTFNTSGITSAVAEKKVEEAIRVNSGVLGVFASRQSATVEISYEPEKINVEQLKAAIEAQGYKIVEQDAVETEVKKAGTNATKIALIVCAAVALFIVLYSLGLFK